MSANFSCQLVTLVPSRFQELMEASIWLDAIKSQLNVKTGKEALEAVKLRAARDLERGLPLEGTSSLQGVF